jgi:hypothetical protein
MEENDDFDLEETPYQESGLVCEKCGYTDSLKCYIDMPWGDPEPEPDEILCGKHAAEAGYCCCCGMFCAGLDSFEFRHPGYCDNCYDEVRSNFDDDDDDEDWDDLDYNWP